MSSATEVTIQASAREVTGKGYARKLRRNGKVPAILNNKGQSIALELDPKLLSKAWQGGRQFHLELNGDTKLVKITDLQIDPIKRFVLHVDLTYAS